MINNIFFGIAPALSAIFQLGFEPTEECFFELTCESYCHKSDKKFVTYQDKLKYVASLLPPVFTKDSSYKRSHLKLVET